MKRTTVVKSLFGLATFLSIASSYSGRSLDGAERDPGVLRLSFPDFTPCYPGYEAERLGRPRSS
jgi:hypothetical protein